LEFREFDYEDNTAFPQQNIKDKS